jgi:hypothetical protein
LLKKSKISSLARLVHSIGLATKPTLVIKGKGVFRAIIKCEIEHEPDDGSSGASFTVIAVHGHDSKFIIYM